MRKNYQLHESAFLSLTYCTVYLFYILSEVDSEASVFENQHYAVH